VRVLCCAAARPARRPGVESFQVAFAGAHRPQAGGPSGCMVDSAGTVRPLRTPTPLIAWGLQCSVQRTHRTFARSMPGSRRACVRPCSGALSHRVSKPPGTRRVRCAEHVEPTLKPIGVEYVTLHHRTLPAGALATWKCRVTPLDRSLEASRSGWLILTSPARSPTAWARRRFLNFF
jgi:hypothetical protein